MFHVVLYKYNGGDMCSFGYSSRLDLVNRLFIMDCSLEIKASDNSIFVLTTTATTEYCRCGLMFIKQG